MNKQIVIRIISGIIMISIMGLIFSFSAQNGEESSGVSGRVVQWIQTVFIEPLSIQDEQINKFLEENLGFFVRKLAHFSIYTALGMSATGFFLTFENISRKKQYLLAGILGCAYAITDEIHQLFSPGRSGKPEDVLLDSCGVLIGLCILCFFQILFENRKKKI